MTYIVVKNTLFKSESMKLITAVMHVTLSLYIAILLL